MNRLVQPATATTAEIGCPLYDPLEVCDSRQRFRREAVPALRLANSVYVPTGRYATRAWVLVARSDYNKLNKYSSLLRLELGDPNAPDNVASLKNLSIVQARCVTRGIAADDNALYLVELTDGRGVVNNHWFQFPLSNWYNVRAPGYPQTFYPGSMNGGTTWTWSTMLSDIWTRMSTFLGAYPGFPAGFTTNSTPENWWSPGGSAWQMLNDALSQIGLTVACDLTSAAAPFTLVRPGNADASFAALTAKYEAAGNLEDDLEWIDTGAARVPKTVVVYFRRRNSIYGSEETTSYGDNNIAKQWSMVPSYSVSVTAPATFSSATGTHHLWSDFTVRHDQNGDPLAADTATAAQIAADNVTDYFAKIYRQTLGYMQRTYSGALPFTTGSQVDGVRWFQDYSINERSGWCTQLVRGPHPPWPDVIECHI